MYKELNSLVPTKKDGFFQVDKDLEALEEYLKFVKENSMEFPCAGSRIEYLIKNDYYEDFLKNHTESTIAGIYSIYEEKDFEFKSFMSAFKFYNDYAMKDRITGQWLETFKDRCLAVSLSLTDNERDACIMFESMLSGEYQPATPTFLNAGKKYRGEFISCFLLDTYDNLDSITKVIGDGMKLSKLGGGVAINLSNLRGRGESVNKNPNACKGVVPVAKILEDSFNYADQMGQRKGAGVVYLNVFHWDIMEFLDTKKINADEKSRLQTISQGLIVPSLFFDLIKDNKEINLFSTYNMSKAGYCKETFPMITRELYDKMCADDQVIKKKINARSLLLAIAKNQFESGYPYLIYIDNANKQHANYGEIRMSNLCTEIFQHQFYKNEIDDQEYDISCVLGSVNIAHIMQNISNFGNVIDVAVKTLSRIAETFPNHVKSVYNSNIEFRSIGIGAMNLYGYLIKEGIAYGSTESIEFCKAFFMLMNFYSLRSSMELAKQKGPYKLFERSKYASGVYFDEYLPHTIEKKDLKYVSHLFEFLPTKNDWESLKRDVMKYGLYNAYRLTVAPTQSISYIQNSTPSILPPADIVEARTYGNSTTYFPAPFLSPNNQVFYKTAYQTDQIKMIDLVAEIQKHVDQGISTTLFVTSHTSTKQLMKYYIHAHNVGLKSLYYTRTKNLTIEECHACQL